MLYLNDQLFLSFEFYIPANTRSHLTSPAHPTHPTTRYHPKNSDSEENVSCALKHGGSLSAHTRKREGKSVL